MQRKDTSSDLGRKLNKDFGKKKPHKLLEFLVICKYQNAEWDVWETSTVFRKKCQSYQLCSRNKKTTL